MPAQPSSAAERPEGLREAKAGLPRWQRATVGARDSRVGLQDIRLKAAACHLRGPHLALARRGGELGEQRSWPAERRRGWLSRSLWSVADLVMGSSLGARPVAAD